MMVRVIGAAAQAIVDAVVAREFLVRKGEFAAMKRGVSVEYVAYWPDGNVTMAWSLS